MESVDNRLCWPAGKKRVLCVGSILVEQIHIVKRYPQINKTMRSIKSYFQRGGGASATVTVLRNLGVEVEHLSMLSTADLFSIILEDMRKRGIIMENCPFSDKFPPVSIVIIPSVEQKSLIAMNDEFPMITVEDFKKLDLNKYGWVHFRGTNVESTIEMMKLVCAHKEKIIVSMDIFKDFAGVFPLVNYCDFAIVTKYVTDELKWRAPEEACTNLDEKLRMRWGINLKRPYVLFCREFEGAHFMDLQGICTHVPGYKPKKIVDPNGADSVFTAAFIYATYVRERSLAEAVDFANRMYSHKCTNIAFDHVIDILRSPVL